ncbi:uncharacterized protein LOC34619999 [Cyclospora cayetanensis]|uniref:Uncharacterized protein LOC34619999 n=1 Tax=Cyclospora cayetanensis TaxID=88456 RepID=A0A6P6RWC0_9EIME|nr:uncharacterized protein LOC34619999 [Cyclospora cayetanensis]
MTDQSGIGCSGVLVYAIFAAATVLVAVLSHAGDALEGPGGESSLQERAWGPYGRGLDDNLFVGSPRGEGFLKSLHGGRPQNGSSNYRLLARLDGEEAPAFNELTRNEDQIKQDAQSSDNRLVDRRMDVDSQKKSPLGGKGDTGGTDESLSRGGETGTSIEGLASSDPASAGEYAREIVWDVPDAADDKALGLSPSDSSGSPLMLNSMLSAFQLDLEEKLHLHKSRFHVAPKVVSPTGSFEPLHSVSGDLCSKILIRVVQKPTRMHKAFSRVMARLGTAFRKVKAGARIMLAKMERLFERSKAGQGSESKAIQWVKKMGTVAWEKMRAFIKNILSIIIRFLPLILFIMNLVFWGMSIVSLVAAVNPISVIAVISTTCSLLSFIFSSSSQTLTRKTTRLALAEKSEFNDMQLFGLKWGELRAEQSLEAHKTALDLGRLDESQEQEPGRKHQPEGVNRQRSTPDVSEGDAREADKGGGTGGLNVVNDEWPNSPGKVEEGGTGNAPAIEKAGKATGTLPSMNTGVSDAQSSETLAPEELSKVRRIMLERATSDRIKAAFQKAKLIYREAKKKKANALRKAWNITKASVRLVAESLLFGLDRVFARFGRAWQWAVEVGLKRIIRYFRMLKLFGIIAAWFEKIAAFVKWFAGQGRFYVKVFDVMRSTASFLLVNQDKIGALVKGTIQVSASAVDTTVFLALFLSAITKPVYGLYFAYQGMLEDKTKGEAMREFKRNRKAFVNFLLGSAAMEGDIG